MRPVLLILACLLLLRLPFLNQPVQGDDIYYLAGAQHAQIDPLHPNHARYVFLGETVDMRGHPHPPFNAWFLAALLALTGDIREVPYHAAYILFSAIAALGMWSIARRYTPRPLLATLLFLVTPAFVVSGTSLESDLPLLAFWMASVALFIAAAEKRSGAVALAAAALLVMAMMTGYQTVVLVPVLAFFLWRQDRSWKPGWIVLLAAPLALGSWQLYERLATGAMPVEVLGGYFTAYGLQSVTNKLRNAAALAAHLGWLVSPVLVWLAVPRRYWLVALAALPLAFADPYPLFWLSAATGLVLLLWCARSEERFLAVWVCLFFAAALVLFFAGSARYLLPVAAPVAILVSWRLGPRALWTGFALQAALSLALATVNYQHWDGYRQFARQFRKETEEKRVWINGEWALRYYFEENGGLPLLRGQAVRPGEMVVSSQLAYPISFHTGGGVRTLVREQDITSPIPLRMIALGAKSAWSTATLGLRPFDVSSGPIDRVRMEAVVERKPRREYLNMGDPSASEQIVSGVYELEGGAWRWMAGRAVILLKPPERPSPIEVKFYIPGQAPGRTVTLMLDGAVAASQTFEKPGSYTLRSPPKSGSNVTITIDKEFSTPGDHRRLGMILAAVGFQPLAHETRSP